MNKLQWIMLLIGSNLPIAEMLLRNKDTNSTGADDMAADLMGYTSKVLQALQFGLPIPDLPSSLRPKISTGEEEVITGGAGTTGVESPIVSSAK